MIKKMIFWFFTCALILSFQMSCSSKTHDIEAAVSSLSTDELINDVKILSSDEFEGRFPASPGEEKAVNFIKEEFDY